MLQPIVLDVTNMEQAPFLRGSTLVLKFIEAQALGVFGFGVKKGALLLEKHSHITALGCSLQHTRILSNLTNPTTKVNCSKRSTPQTLQLKV